jgi:hypothetical protein
MDSKLLISCHFISYHIISYHIISYQKDRCLRLPTISEIFSPRSFHCSAWSEERSERRLVVHANNARPHTTKVRKAFCDDYDNFLRIALHPSYPLYPLYPLYPPYSPDLAPSDFFLSLIWASQNRLQGHQFRYADELLSKV